MKASAVSETSRQPSSIVSEWPRPGILLISVVPELRLWRLNAALASDHGTVLSRSPSMISSGPRSGCFVLTLASVQGLMFANAAWKIGFPGAATWNVSYSW